MSEIQTMDCGSLYGKSRKASMRSFVVYACVLLHICASAT
jgi:hypothetical protein